MARAIVLIGVRKVRGRRFHILQAVDDAITRMQAWARGQGITDIVTITDAPAQEVTASRIKQAVFELVHKRNDLEQLIVYFSGHGVVKGFHEFWLLSHAPDDVDEAVNVTGSMALARACRIPHIVFVSDACRTPTDTLQLTRLNGCHIFPAIEDVDVEHPADIFYATKLGAPALEVAEDGETYVAAYTDVLVEALNGKSPALIQEGHIRPRPLAKWLLEAVPRSLAGKNLRFPASQRPHADIASEDHMWLARFGPPMAAAGQEPLPSLGTAVPQADAAGAAQEEGQAAAEARPTDALQAAEDLVSEALRQPPSTSGRLAAWLRHRHRRERWRWRRPMFESPEDAVATMPHASLLVVGRGVRLATCPGHAVRLQTWLDGCAIFLEDLAQPAQVLVEFDDGSGMLLPALPGQQAILPFEDGHLRDPRYAPDDSVLAQASEAELGPLRTAIHDAMAIGAFSPDRENTLRLVARLRTARFLDPVLAVYAAYACERVGRSDWIRDLRDGLTARSGLRLFDLELLSRGLLRRDAPAGSVLPDVPLLAAGWVFMEALCPDFPAGFPAELRSNVQGPLWAHYAPAAMQVLQSWLMPDSHAAEFHMTP